MGTRSRPVLLTALLALVLSACGQTPSAATTPAAPTSGTTSSGSTAAPADATAAPDAGTAPTTAPATGEMTDLELWVSASVSEAGPPPADWAVYDIVREKLGVNLKIVMLPTDFADADAKINAAAAANALPDLFQVNRDTWYRLVEAGLIAPVDDLLPQMPERTKTHYSDEQRNKLVTLDGVMYGLADPGALPRTDGLVVRQDWLDKLGLKAPTNLDEFMTVAKAFTEQDPDGNGQNDTYGLGAFLESPGFYSMGLGPRFDFIYGAYGVAGVWNLAQDSFGLNVRNPNYMQATQYVKSLIDAKVIDPDWPTLKKDEFRARWKQGKYGMMIENFAALSTKANYKDFDTNFPEGEFAVLAPPAGPDGKRSTGVSVQSARIFAVSQTAAAAGKGPKIAGLLEWMSNDEGYYLVGFGQEGVNYVRDEQGFVSTEGIPAEKAWTSKEQQPLTQLRNMVFINNDVELKARYVTYQTANGRTMDPLSFWKGFSEQPWTDATGAAVINPPANAADFTRFYSENIVNFVLGQQPVDEPTWQQFLAGLDGLGAGDLEASAKETLVKSGFLK
ncbi:MAG TPA: hypothetical protein VFS21_26550 [Roseiflexaceae bacterium]|nr:hypothetical protein [Roseiflexaceae bacterium]